ncbi:MAG: hypothetical protein ACRC8A_01805 [Microcoleaceae cyanobacterium]
MSQFLELIQTTPDDEVVTSKKYLNPSAIISFEFYYSRNVKGAEISSVSIHFQGDSKSLNLRKLSFTADSWMKFIVDLNAYAEITPF